MQKIKVKVQSHIVRKDNKKEETKDIKKQDKAGE